MRRLSRPLLILFLSALCPFFAACTAKQSAPPPPPAAPLPTAITGQILTPDGQPAAHAYVYLATPDHPVQLRDTTPLADSGLAYAKSDLQGRFQLPLPSEPCTLVALHHQGLAEIHTQNLPAPTITLDAWGRVTGLIRRGFDPLKETQVRITHQRDDSLPTHAQCVIRQTLIRETDAQGEFDFHEVLPGTLVVSYSTGGRRSLPLHSLVANQTVRESADLLPGQRLHLDLGGAFGLTGKVVLSDRGLNSSQWIAASGTLRAVPDPTAAPGHAPTSLTYDFNPQINYPFYLVDVQPGAYDLAIQILQADPQTKEFTRLGTITKRVTIPTTQAPASPQAALIDLGLLLLKPLPAPAAVGPKT